MKYYISKLPYFLLIISYSLFTSCHTTAQISKKAEALLIADTAISKGFIGISVFDPSTNTYLYNYNADKYFVPASNTKLFTLYAGMKYLGDSLVGLRYGTYNDSTILITSTGDPTFLHQDFASQKVFNFFKNTNKKILWNYITRNHFDALGSGWAWNDYSDDYMAERSSFPIYGNLTKVYFDNDTLKFFPDHNRIDYENNNYDDCDTTEVRKPYKISSSYYRKFLPEKFKIRRRSLENNSFERLPSNVAFRTTYIPMHLSMRLIWGLVKDTVGKGFGFTTDKNLPFVETIKSQPSDSLFKPMMYRSDNFFAEQTLLMASNELLGYMSDEAIIDTILKSSLNNIPHKPRWVDGSGLSRYNLFTPQDFVYILNKMKTEFGMERMKTILATGGEGTLKNYFLKDVGFIYAKTGTLSNNCALSGYLITKKNKLLIFSVLANNYQTGATPVRRAVEGFLQFIRDNY